MRTAKILIFAGLLVTALGVYIMRHGASSKPVPADTTQSGSDVTDNSASGDNANSAPHAGTSFDGYVSLDIMPELSRPFENEQAAVAAISKAYRLSARDEKGQAAQFSLRYKEGNASFWSAVLTNIADDSLAGMQYLAKLIPQGEFVKITRIGKRWTCRRGANPNEWTIELCP